MRVALGLGSNLGDRPTHLKTAIEKLEAILSEVKISPAYESSAVLLPGSPLDWNIPFLNMVVSGNTTLSPKALLKKVKVIEQDMGRPITYDKWSPRIIDIDILLMDDLVIEKSSLTVPHSHLLTRDFCIWPLANIEPAWRYPGSEKSILELAVLSAPDFPDIPADSATKIYPLQ